MYSYHVWHHCWGYKICGAYVFCHCVQHVLMSGLIMHDQRNANTSCCWCRRRLFPSAPSKPIVCTRIDRRVTCEQTGNFVRVWTGGIIPTSKAQKRNKTPRQRSCPSLLHLINFGPLVLGSCYACMCSSTTNTIFCPSPFLLEFSCFKHKTN